MYISTSKGKESDSNFLKFTASIVDDQRLWEQFKEELNNSNVVTNRAGVRCILHAIFCDEEKNKKYSTQNKLKIEKTNNGRGFLFLRDFFIKGNNNDRRKKETMSSRRSFDFLREVSIKAGNNEDSQKDLITNLKEDGRLFIESCKVDDHHRSSMLSFLTMSSVPLESSITLDSSDPYLSADTELEILSRDIKKRKVRKFPSTHSRVGLSTIEQQQRDIAFQKMSMHIKAI